MLVSLFMAALGGLEDPSAMTQELTTADIVKLPVPPLDHSLPYGAHPLQVGHAIASREVACACSYYYSR